ncbi:hypothetical protein KSP39_PZI006177 [Platanthera zijinensis]|uniref:Uncharacterized protein n=1 Tax=Platanthera zijinensis TaxID=2320716 RepID=A0AAP0GB13_9ASPA
MIQILLAGFFYIFIIVCAWLLGNVNSTEVSIVSKKILIYIYIYICMYVCMYVYMSSLQANEKEGEKVVEDHLYLFMPSQILCRNFCPYIYFSITTCSQK